MGAPSKQSECYSQLSRRHQLQYGMNFFSPYLEKGQKVLDLGCGTGDLTMTVGELVDPGHVLGIDPDSERLNMAQESYAHVPNITFINCKGSEISTEGREGQFDVVISNAVIHWMDYTEKKRCFENVLKLLKPGGLFLAQFCSILPPNLREISTFLGADVLQQVESMFYTVTEAEFAKLCQDVGFYVNKSDLYIYSTVWESLESLCEFYYSSFHGVVDFAKALEKKKREYGGKCPIKWEEDKELHHFTHLFRFVLKKE